MGSAAGKVILFGEHSVVYGRPALAVPVSDLRAKVRVEARSDPGFVIHALDLGRDFKLDQAAVDDPLAAIIKSTLAELHVPPDISLELWIESDIPVAGGLGSGAAVSTAIARALSAYYDRPLSQSRISALVFEVERLHHGTPSGIDNAVIALEQPIRFTSREGARPISIARPFTLVIAQTATTTPTRVTVGDVRRAWEKDRRRYEEIFEDIAGIVKEAEAALASGKNEELGPLMNRNQELLRVIDVSSKEIELLIRAGLGAGAAGAKLSGGGRGGNVVLYVEPDKFGSAHSSLLAAGATSVFMTTVGANQEEKP